jgi:hypothetical protein
MYINRSFKLVMALVIVTLLVVTDIGSGVQARPLPQGSATLAATTAQPQPRQCPHRELPNARR